MLLADEYDHDALIGECSVEAIIKIFC